jgi:hypothetical protein
VPERSLRWWARGNGIIDTSGPAGARAPYRCLAGHREDSAGLAQVQAFRDYPTRNDVSETVSTSVIAAFRNEPRERFERLVHSLRRQQLGHDFELVVAAPIEDRSRYSSVSTGGRLQTIELISNETGERSRGLNAALRAAGGQFVVRVDARSLLPPTYVARCTDRLLVRPDIGVVGGVQLPVATAGGPRAAGIARAL